MKFSKLLLLSAAAIFLSPILKVYPQETNIVSASIFGEPSPIGNAFNSLLVATNRDESFWATESFRLDREKLIGRLMTILKWPNSDNAKIGAIAILGDYRAVEAIPFMVQYLDWDDVPHQPVSVSVWFYSHIPTETVEALVVPVSAALEKIGTPAIPALLDKIEQTDDTNINTRCVSICRDIEGSEVTQFRLQELSDKESDSKKKERLQFALDVLKKPTSIYPVKYIQAEWTNHPSFQLKDPLIDSTNTVINSSNHSP